MQAKAIDWEMLLTQREHECILLRTDLIAHTGSACWAGVGRVQNALHTAPLSQWPLRMLFLKTRG